MGPRLPGRGVYKPPCLLDEILQFVTHLRIPSQPSGPVPPFPLAHQSLSFLLFSSTLFFTIIKMRFTAVVIAALSAATAGFAQSLSKSGGDGASSLTSAH